MTSVACVVCVRVRCKPTVPNNPGPDSLVLPWSYTGSPLVLPWEQVCMDVCDGLRFCHTGGDGAFPGEVILHRDLKPANILLRRERGSGSLVAALGDFGLSKLYPVDGAARTVHLIGTPG